jgi:hypothetical protein
MIRVATQLSAVMNYIHELKFFIVALLFNWTGAPYFIIGENLLGCLLLYVSVVGSIVGIYIIYKHTEDKIIICASVISIGLTLIWPFVIMLLILNSINPFDTSKVGPW